MKRTHKKSVALGLVLVGLMAGSACAVRHTVSVGTHMVKVTRHGMEKKFKVDDPRTGVPTLEYAGLSPDGKGLKVSIRGDEVKINDVAAGRLRPGDSILIGDDGVAVNAMDYGESAKYLRENGTGTGTGTETSSVR